MSSYNICKTRILDLNGERYLGGHNGKGFSFQLSARPPPIKIHTGEGIINIYISLTSIFRLAAAR